MIYLDNAATTFPKPAGVYRAVYRFMSRMAANPGRSGHHLSMAAAREVYRCREAAAKLFNAPGPECVAFTLNATQAINFALKGAVKSGHVVTSSLEHNAVARPLYKLSQQGVAVGEAEVDLSDDETTINHFEHLIRPDTVMIACTHASNVCGRVLPAAAIGELCKKNGLLFLLDASQSAGLVPIDMQAMHIDYLCVPGHKGLYGPMGTGMLITSSGDKLDTLIEGGTGSNSIDFNQPEFMPDRMESGTVNAPGIAGLRAGIEFLEHHGRGILLEREMRLAGILYDLLSEMKGVQLYTPRPEADYVPVVSFNVEGLHSVEASAKLDSMGLELRGGLHCSPKAHQYFGTLEQGMIRASLGAFSNLEDIQALARGVYRLSKK